jgi:hypothetical protein
MLKIVLIISAAVGIIYLYTRYRENFTIHAVPLSNTGDDASCQGPIGKVADSDRDMMPNAIMMEVIGYNYQDLPSVYMAVDFHPVDVKISWDPEVLTYYITIPFGSARGWIIRTYDYVMPQVRIDGKDASVELVRRREGFNLWSVKV